MSDECLVKQKDVINKHQLSWISRHLRLCIASSVGLLFFCLAYYLRMLPTRFIESVPVRTSISSAPTLARVFYLFVCQNQAEVDAYSDAFPSVSADAMFYCWGENCMSSKFRSLPELYVAPWSHKEIRNRTLIRRSVPQLFYDNTLFYRVQPRVFIINELQLKLTQNMTVNTKRNKLLARALEEEVNQGWRWSYINIADGDIHTECPLAEQLLTNKSVVNYGGVDELVFATFFRSLVQLSSLKGEARCFLLIDAFILSVSPAIGAISGAGVTMIFPGLLTQILYHIDGIFNAIHRDAVPFLLPYCTRYDARSWWISQAILVYRSLCLYGHVIHFDGVYIARQIHRPFPHAGDPFAIDNDMNLVPKHLVRLQEHMKTARHVSPLVLHNYGGWSRTLTSDICRQHHTAMEPDTCLVHGDKGSLST